MTISIYPRKVYSFKLILVLREDDMTKFMRIESILDSMDFNDNIKNQKLLLKTPPILRGFEKNLIEINKKDKLHKSENILNSILNKNEEGRLFMEKLTNNTTIKTPPNFLV